MTATTTIFPSSSVKFLEQDDMLKYYFKQLRKTKVPTDEEERELLIAYKNGDQTARDKIILGHQRFVFSIAKIYAKDNSELIDYVNEGNIGLIEALDKFNLECGTKFLTFATWYVRRQMNYYIINTRDSVIKSNAMKLFKKVDRINQSFFVINGRYPSNEEIKDELKRKYNIKITDNRDLFDTDIKLLGDSLDDSEVPYEESREFEELTSSHNICEEEEDKNYRKAVVMNLLKHIPQRHVEMVKKLYGIGYDREYSISEVAKENGLTEEGLRSNINIIFESIRQKFENREYYNAVV